MAFMNDQNLDDKLMIKKRDDSTYWFIIMDGNGGSHGIILKEYDLVKLYYKLKDEVGYIINKEEGNI